MTDPKPAAAVDLEALKRVAEECPFETPGGYCKACQNALHHCACAARAHYRNAVRNPVVVLALLAELEQLRVGAPRWIACSDRMPESNDRHVLIRGERWTDCELGLLSRDEDGEFDGWECGEETSYYLSDITHWCPVPAFAAPALPEAVKP